MTERVTLSLRVPERIVEAYEEELREKFGMVAPYAGMELERELRAFVGEGDLAAIEETVYQLVRAAGRRPRDRGKKENVLSRASFDGPTKDYQCRIHEGVRASFMEHIKDAEQNAGQIIAAILVGYIEGGTEARISEKLDRVAADARSLLAELDDETAESMPPSEKRALAVARELPADCDLPRKKVKATIAEMLGTTDHFYKTYMPKVINRLGLVPHPNNEDLLITPEKRDRIENTELEERREAAVNEASTMTQAIDEAVPSRAAADGGTPVDDRHLMERD